jgi:hypothetical protein
MEPRVEPTLPLHEPATQRGVVVFREALRERPVRTAAGLALEYAMFASAVGLALALFATRVPLRFADRALGLRLRERFIDLLARVSPG